MTDQHLTALRAEMKKYGADVYFVPSSDFHLSEYTGGHFKVREYLCGFKGSAGTLVVTQEDAGLWTDGRYFIQAEKELSGSGARLFRMGEEGVPTVYEYLEKVLPQGGKLAFDGRVVSALDGERLEEIAGKKGAGILWQKDLCEEIWTDRPPIEANPVFRLDEKYCGQPAREKLAAIREAMEQERADCCLLSALDDMAWTYNLRGSDVAYNPVFMSYSLIFKDRAVIFAQDQVISAEIKEELAKDNIQVEDYEQVYSVLSAMEPGCKVLLDKSKTNYALLHSLPSKEAAAAVVSPVVLMRAKKNPVEIENLKRCHVKDGVAVTKFMYWLKTNVDRIPMTEITAEEKLEEFRKEQELYICPSFGTISAYRGNAAMMHYSASPESCAVLEPEGMLLVDSGGQYYDGTTDITRTFILGEITKEEKFFFTTVLRSVLNLQSARFLYGCTGQNLDILARGPLWDVDVDYKCGTGHGVGFLLGVHEAPNGFRWKIVPERNDSCVLEAGMVTTDEPGVYLEGQFGIRTENELLCCKGNKVGSDQFMYFEPLTLVPIDLDGVDPSLLTFREKQALNDYHQKVWETISPYLEEDEREWLRAYTLPV